MREALFAGVIGFIVALAATPAVIRALQRLRAGQSIRKDGPAGHAVKAGTPTMGGVVIVLAATIATLLFAQPMSSEAIYLIMPFIGFAVLGLADDFFKVAAKRSLGLRARQKLIVQILLALIVSLYALNASGPEIIIPFSTHPWEAPPLLFLLISVVTIIGAVNAVNITDGLDGLAAGSTTISAGVMSVIALGLGFVDGAVFAAAVAGACLGFSWYNAHPAQVFMGDTGSLALGGALGSIAVLTGTQFILLIVGGLFAIETLSVILQVAYFRLTHGRRIFRMSPIHHHFELVGWKEPQIVTRFWAVALILGLIGLLSVHQG